MFLHVTFIGLMLWGVPCLSCTTRWTLCKLPRQDPSMMEKHAEFLLKLALDAANQAQIGDHLSVTSCLKTQHASIIVCTAEISQFTNLEVFFHICVPVFQVQRFRVLISLFLFVLGKFIVCRFLFIQFYRRHIQCFQNVSAGQQTRC